jgi:hypothetical protein
MSSRASLLVKEGCTPSRESHNPHSRYFILTNSDKGNHIEGSGFQLQDGFESGTGVGSEIAICALRRSTTGETRPEQGGV